MPKSEEKIATILAEIENVAAREGIPIVGPIKGKFLGELVRKFRPTRVLEVGTAVGYSAIHIAANLSGSGKLETIEINPKSAERAVENLERAGLARKVSVIAADARKIVPGLAGPYDFVFIDAVKRDYYVYLKMLEEKIPAGGVVVADNAKIFASAMEDYLNEVRGSGFFASETADFGFDAMEVSIKIKNSK
jgi:predicted O-methyltransferase YrrM